MDSFYSENIMFGLEIYLIPHIRAIARAKLDVSNHTFNE